MAGDRKRFLEKVNFRIATLLFAALSMFSCGWLAPRKPASDFTRLVELMRLEDRSTPVYPFNDFVKRFDQSGHKTTLAYFNKRSDLINKIRKDLGGKDLQWRLDDFEQRLLYVPEIREEYAALYENYCHEVIDFILQETELDNPFTNIETLDHIRPEIPQKKGVAVFLVHNLAREYVGTYSFFNENHQKEVKISLRGRMFIGEIGSYSSMLEIQDDGTVQFRRNRYTIWQNSAVLPYNALIVPIEETLHIALRQSTEAAILKQLRALNKKTYPEVEQIVEHWISIEEAVVGGLVDILFPQVASRYIAGFPRTEIEKSVHSKLSIKKYRYLQKGIEVVKAIGFKAAIGIYRRHPEKFRDMVVSGTDRALKL
ncbi:MAG: hypothetical protein JSW26_24235 [Desulfobacterales bacterium]|nr:MAG: hypothetical protein JSW26_24235 [Desulfobacterales bacterium]